MAQQKLPRWQECLKAIRGYMLDYQQIQWQRHSNDKRSVVIPSPYNQYFLEDIVDMEDEDFKDLQIVTFVNKKLRKVVQIPL